MRLVLLALFLAAPAFAAPTLSDDLPVADGIAATRAVVIGELRRYANAGAFPRNDFQPGLASQLLDANGTPCAMADLVIASGHRDLVEAASAVDNGLRFGGLTQGPLYDWVLTSGLTLEEAAMIQVPEMYVGPELEEGVEDRLLAAEIARQQAHLLSVADQLEAYSEQSIATIVARWPSS